MMDQGKRLLVGPLKVWICHYKALHPYPTSFLYKGRCFPMSGGRMCSKSVGGILCCSQLHQLENGRSTDIFHFDIWLCDSYNVNQPQRVTICDCVEPLLEFTATKFRKLSEHDQNFAIQGMVNQMP